MFQTVPSLALFGLLIPVFGIGAWTAITALVVYALLPIVRNTYVGIAGVDPAVREAGRGMGMTDGELLRLVELPLAAGVILAGVRIATAAYAEGVIPPYYDSLIAKLIVRGKDRDEAVSRMARALEMFIVEGIFTTIPLHRKILADADFRTGRVDTTFIERFLAVRKEETAD